MSDPYDGVEPNRIKHLELVQAVVARLAGSSFLVKGWAVTITTALVGFAVSQNESRLAWIAIAPVLLFWWLDAYYLWAERLFRGLHEQVRRSNPKVEPFYMAATSDTLIRELKSQGVEGVDFKD